MSRYVLSTGTVQCRVTREEPYFSHHFGRAEYQRELPILTDSIRSKAQPIVDKLNSGELSEDDAVKLLNEIYW